jgi:hypothetical protein
MAMGRLAQRGAHSGESLGSHGDRLVETYRAVLGRGGGAPPLLATSA